MSKRSSRSKSRRKPLTEEERTERRERQRERLVAATEQLLTSEGWERWIRVRRHNGLSRYSANNQFLLVLEAYRREVELTYVAGYRWWADNGYQVRKGEKALHVLGPVSRKVEDEQTGELKLRVVGFREVAVFDRSQVDAGPEAVAIEPPASEPLCGDSHAEVLPKLEALAAEIGCTVTYDHQLREGAGGFFRRSDKLIAVRRGEPNAMVRTLLHELAHAMVAAKRDEKTRSVDGYLLDYAEEECVVECAGHVAASAVGLDTSGEAISYLASWGEGMKLGSVAQAASLVDELAGRLEAAVEGSTANTTGEAVAA